MSPASLRARLGCGRGGLFPLPYGRGSVTGAARLRGGGLFPLPYGRGSVTGAARLRGGGLFPLPYGRGSVAGRLGYGAGRGIELFPLPYGRGSVAGAAGFSRFLTGAAQLRARLSCGRGSVAGAARVGCGGGSVAPDNSPRVREEAGPSFYRFLNLTTMRFRSIQHLWRRPWSTCAACLLGCVTPAERRRDRLCACHPRRTPGDASLVADDVSPDHGCAAGGRSLRRDEVHRCRRPTPGSARDPAGASAR